jgi:hypothetical protein
LHEASSLSAFVLEAKALVGLAAPGGPAEPEHRRGQRED